MTTRCEGERVRMRHTLARMRATLENFEVSLGIASETQPNLPVGGDSADAITRTAIELATQIARHDAFVHAEQDASNLRGLCDNLEARAEAAECSHVWRNRVCVHCGVKR